MCDLTDCLFEEFNIRKLDGVLWQFIPQDDRHWIEGKLIMICSSMNLPIRKRVHVGSKSYGTLSICWQQDGKQTA